MRLSAEIPLSPRPQEHFFEDPTCRQVEKAEIDTAPMNSPKNGAAAKIVDLEQWMEALAFTPENGKIDEYVRRFDKQGLLIRVSRSGNDGKGIIDYGSRIKVGRETVTNLSQTENMVVLSCVCRLLDQGYAPSEITLEKPYKVGLDDKFLDILVSKKGKAFLMIECKTAGQEYQAELKKLKANGGQLLSYYPQDRGVSYIALYCSKPVAVSNRASRQVVLETAYEAIDANGLTGNNLSENFASWNQETFSSGLFEEAPYQIAEHPLRVKDLVDMKPEDGGKIFNSFAEILRRHVISDEPNAFNKIFNLFICKVQDEEKEGDEEKVDFQWMSNESPEAALNRLNDLYKRGLKSFLNMDVADHTWEELEASFVSMSEKDRAALRKMFNELRLYKNNEFAFIEVYDKETFEQNAEVVKSVVRLLQRKRLRYSEKQPFMGDFFERLLNTSVKQKSGQFFTPIPIARFVCDSLPFEKIIDAKIEAGDANFLPYIIDYASGSGHFLTEGLNRIDSILQLRVRDNRFKGKSIRENARAWSHGYKWASRFVYGVEKDYRLAKTSKVSCFLNGDGEANIIRGDGLGHFHYDKSYQKCGNKIWKPKDDKALDNPVFDVILANPPFSVKQCKTTIDKGDESFELFDRLSPESKEIEVLFLERTKHLLKEGGVAGIIFPVSLLSNGGICTDARILLLKHFKIVALVAFGPSTFMKTGTVTTAMFLIRRKPNDCQVAAKLVEDFCEGERFQDGAAFGHPNAFNAFARDVHGCLLADYANNLRNPELLELEIFKDYKRNFGESKEKRDLLKTKAYKTSDRFAQAESEFRVLKSYILAREKTRMECYLLTLGQNVITVRAPEKKEDEIRFLGYEFTDRMEHAGMRLLSGTGTIDTPLYDAGTSDNPNKINTLIKRGFSGEDGEIEPALTPWCARVPLWKLVAFDLAEFDALIRTAPKMPSKQFVCQTEKLGVLCDIRIGGTPSRNKPQFYQNGTNLWVSYRDINGNTIMDTKEKITDEAVEKSSVKIVSAGTVLMTFKLTIGKVAMAGVDLYTNEAIAALPVRDAYRTKIDADFLLALLSLFPGEIIQHENQGGNKFGKCLNIPFMKLIDIPLLSANDRKTFCATFADPKLSLEQKRQTLSRLLWG